MRHLFAVAVAVLTVASAAQTPTTTEQVIAAMHESLCPQLVSDANF